MPTDAMLLHQDSTSNTVEKKKKKASLFSRAKAKLKKALNAPAPSPLALNAPEPVPSKKNATLGTHPGSKQSSLSHLPSDSSNTLDAPIKPHPGIQSGLLGTKSSRSSAHSLPLTQPVWSNSLSKKLPTKPAAHVSPSLSFNSPGNPQTSPQRKVPNLSIPPPSHDPSLNSNKYHTPRTSNTRRNSLPYATTVTPRLTPKKREPLPATNPKIQLPIYQGLHQGLIEVTTCGFQDLQPEVKAEMLLHFRQAINVWYNAIDNLRKPAKPVVMHVTPKTKRTERPIQLIVTKRDMPGGPSAEWGGADTPAKVIYPMSWIDDGRYKSTTAMTHEVGHVFGLADNYVLCSSTQPYQPPSIMSGGRARRSSPTQTDKLSVACAFRRNFLSEVYNCPPGFCVPTDDQNIDWCTVWPDANSRE